MANRVLPFYGNACAPAPSGARQIFAQQRAFLSFYRRCLGFTGWLVVRKKLRDRDADVAAVREHLSEGSGKFLSALAARGLLHCDFGNLGDTASWKGSIICANHPSILDALCFFWKMPGIGCVVGANPRGNPLFSTTARFADFVPSDPALRMLKECRQRLARGENILLFPEGTRTTRGAVDPFLDGPALLAIKARAPIRTVFIETSSLFLGKGYSVFKTTDVPIRFRFSAGGVFEPRPGETAREFARRLETYFRESLAREGERIFRIHDSRHP